MERYEQYLTHYLICFLSYVGTDLDPTEPIVATDLDGDPVMYFIQPNSLNSNHFGVRTEITGPGSQGILYLLNASSLDVSCTPTY